MKSIFYLSSDGFPTRKNINLGIFSYEQVISEKNKKFFCIDLLTNNSSRIKINFFKKKEFIDYLILNLIL